MLDGATRLESLEIVAVDCQATSAASAGGRLIELGWCRALPGAPRDALAACARLIAQEPPSPLPWRIVQLTGISDEELRAGARASDAWRELAGLTSPRTPLIAHFAKFELPFLQALSGGELPVEVLCTHEISRRLWPDLPRRGLRPVAGMLGHVLPEHRRAGEHARATAFVWGALVQELATRGIHDVAALRQLLATEPPPRSARRHWPMRREARLSAPDAPGVYRLRASSGALLYVGKATSLRRRVNSYFQKRWRGDDRKLELLTQVADVEWSVTETQLEAALLETDDIKELAPLYNRALRARAPELWYARRDLRGAVPSADAQHPVGPLPREGSLDAFTSAMELLGSAECRDEGAARRALRLPDFVRAPEPAALAQALALLRSRWTLESGPLSLPRMLQLGVCLWWAEQAGEAEGEDASDDLGELFGSGVSEPRSWRDPESIASSLEMAIRIGAHLVRRARWTRQLADGIVSWEAGPRWRWLSFRDGRVTARGDAAATPECPPASPERPRAPLDFAAYERLRVLTTELRALLAKGARVEVRLDGGRLLDSAHLSRRLFWV